MDDYVQVYEIKYHLSPISVGHIDANEWDRYVEAARSAEKVSMGKDVSKVFSLYRGKEKVDYFEVAKGKEKTYCEMTSDGCLLLDRSALMISRELLIKQ